MMETIAVNHYGQRDLLWLVAYLCVGLTLALPAAYLAVRRGLRFGLLIGFGTAVLVTLLGFVLMMVMTMIEGGGAFAVGFGTNIVVIWLGLFFTPALLLELAVALVVRRLARRPRSGTAS
jgi:hypothetical protein